MIFYFAHDLHARTLKKQFYIITTNFLLRMHLQKSNIAVSISNTNVRKSFKICAVETVMNSCKYNFSPCVPSLPRCKLKQIYNTIDGSIT